MAKFVIINGKKFNKAILAKLNNEQAPATTPEAMIRGSLIRETEKACLIECGLADNTFSEIWFPKTMVHALKFAQTKINFEFSIPEWLLNAKNAELPAPIMTMKF